MSDDYMCDCGKIISEEEWEMFDGFCEDCYEALNEESE